MKTIAVTSGYFNPIHPGHVDCFELSKELSDELWVIVNNDKQAFLKRGVESFQDEQYRMRIVSALSSVDRVVLAIDQDGSVVESLRKVFAQIRKEYGDDTKIIFTKGGDRFAREIPEAKVCEEFGVQIVDSLGSKTHSSSDYMKKLQLLA